MGLPRGERSLLPQPLTTDIRGDSITSATRIWFSVHTPVPRKSLSDLACDPLRRRVGCGVDPDEISAINPQNHEADGPARADPVVGTTNKSMAAMSGAWFRRKVRHP